jgi:hypothetical protein
VLAAHKEKESPTKKVEIRSITYSAQGVKVMKMHINDTAELENFNGSKFQHALEGTK